MGAGYNGAVQVRYCRPALALNYPFYFPTDREVALLIRVTVRASSLDVQNLIPDLVMNYVNGELGRCVVCCGVDVSPWEISGAINQQEPLISVQKVELAWSVLALGLRRLRLDIDQVARTQRSSITVVMYEPRA